MLTTVLALVLCVLLLLGALIALIQRQILFPRFAMSPPVPGAGDEIDGLARWWLDIDDGRVEAWWLPGDGVSATTPGPAVIFVHGNAELIDHWATQLASYRRRGVSVLLPEYRDYGRSDGAPSEANISDDMVRFYDRLSGRPEVDPARIFFHGRSLGGGIVCALARQRRPAALILMSTFTSITAMMGRYGVPRFLVRDPFDSIRLVEALDVPILIVHGTRDSLVPYRHAERLHAAAARSELITYDCDHNDCPPDWAAFWRRLDAFLHDAALLPRR